MLEHPEANAAVQLLALTITCSQMLDDSIKNNIAFGQDEKLIDEKYMREIIGLLSDKFPTNFGNMHQRSNFFFSKMSKLIG